MYYTFSFKAGYELEATIDVQGPLKGLKISVKLVNIKLV
jgi:hypothetical protein